MAFFINIKLEKRMWLNVLLADHRKWPEFKTVPGKTISCNWALMNNSTVNILTILAGFNTYLYTSLIIYSKMQIN